MNSYGKRNEKYLYLSGKETVSLTAQTLLVILALNWFFYRRVLAFLPLFFVGAGYFRLKYRDRIEEKRQKAKVEFKELLLLACTGLRAGYSVENALTGSREDLLRLYGKDSSVIRLLSEIEVLRKNHQPVAEAFRKAGKNMAIEDMTEFASVYEVAYKKSGNLSEVMDRTSEGIIEKLRVEEEIYASLNERRFEMRIMNLMPFLIMLYINLTSRGYFDGMYHSFTGVLVMSGAMAVYILAYLWGDRIARIRV